MENQYVLINEYFELLQLLNKTNKLPDEKTKAYFKIQTINESSEKNLYFMISHNQKILVCRKIRAGTWIGSTFTGLNHLEEFLSDALNSEFLEPLDHLELSVRLRRLIFGDQFAAY